jgi:osmoprotectant transport system permease protein
MDVIGDVIAWFGDPEHWRGADGVPIRTLQHIWLSVFPTIIAAALALPLAVWLAHRRIGRFAANTLVNLGRAIPSFGILIVAAVLLVRQGVSLRFWPAVIALVALAIPPMFTNAYAGVVNVSPALVEVGRGMGLTDAQILRRVEVPVAIPVILAGVEISFIQVVATVPLAALLSSGGGLGQYIVRGFAQGRAAIDETFAGAILVAVLTIVLQRLFALAERVLLPAGVRRLAESATPEVGETVAVGPA